MLLLTCDLWAVNGIAYTAPTSSVRQTDLSHELLSGEDQLMVDEPAWLFLKQGTVGVDIDSLLMLHRLIATLTQPCSVVEIPCCYCLRRERQEREMDIKL